MPKCTHVKGGKNSSKVCQKISEENANGNASISKEKSVQDWDFYFLYSPRNFTYKDLLIFYGNQKLELLVHV